MGILHAREIPASFWCRSHLPLQMGGATTMVSGRMTTWLVAKRSVLDINSHGQRMALESSIWELQFAKNMWDLRPVFGTTWEITGYQVTWSVIASANVINANNLIIIHPSFINVSSSFSFSACYNKVSERQAQQAKLFPLVKTRQLRLWFTQSYWTQHGWSWNLCVFLARRNHGRVSTWCCCSFNGSWKGKPDPSLQWNNTGAPWASHLQLVELLVVIDKIFDMKIRFLIVFCLERDVSVSHNFWRPPPKKNTEPPQESERVWLYGHQAWKLKGGSMVKSRYVVKDVEHNYMMIHV